MVQIVCILIYQFTWFVPNNFHKLGNEFSKSALDKLKKKLATMSFLFSLFVCFDECTNLFSCIVRILRSPVHRSCAWPFYSLAQAKQKYRGMFETQKPGNKTSSGEISFNIRTRGRPKVGLGRVSGGVSGLCSHVATVANALWKPRAIRLNVNSVTRSRSVTR